MTTDSDSSTKHKGDVVVVGSSAGGVGALSTLVSTLNRNFPAPIVLAQHLDPQRPSHLGTILERPQHVADRSRQREPAHAFGKRYDLRCACKQTRDHLRWVYITRR